MAVAAALSGSCACFLLGCSAPPLLEPSVGDCVPRITHCCQLSHLPVCSSNRLLRTGWPPSSNTRFPVPSFFAYYSHPVDKIRGHGTPYRRPRRPVAVNLSYESVSLPPALHNISFFYPMCLLTCVYVCMLTLLLLLAC